MIGVHRCLFVLVHGRKLLKDQGIIMSCSYHTGIKFRGVQIFMDFVVSSYLRKFIHHEN